VVATLSICQLIQKLMRNHQHRHNRKLSDFELTEVAIRPCPGMACCNLMHLQQTQRLRRRQCRRNDEVSCMKHQARGLVKELHPCKPRHRRRVRELLRIWRSERAHCQDQVLRNALVRKISCERRLVNDQPVRVTMCKENCRISQFSPVVSQRRPARRLTLNEVQLGIWVHDVCRRSMPRVRARRGGNGANTRRGLRLDTFGRCVDGLRLTAHRLRAPRGVRAAP
jgi:hypothetical protein